MREDGIDRSRARFRNRLRVELSGAVSDFSESRKLQMRIGYAATIGVSVDQVEVLITSASVIATFVTYSSTQASMEAVQSQMSVLREADDVARMLGAAGIDGVSVLESPTLSQDIDPSGGSSGSLVIGIVCGVLGGLLFAGVLVWLGTRSRTADPITKPVLNLDLKASVNEARPPTARPSKQPPSHVHTELAHVKEAGTYAAAI